MSNVLRKALGLIIGESNNEAFKVPKNRPHKKMTERELIQLESEIGARLFGDVPKGHRREFFCLDEKTWIWYEEWNDPKTNKRQNMTVRYEIHSNGILKVQEGAKYSFIEGEELENFRTATTVYFEQVTREVYRLDPLTGQKLA